MGLAIGERSSQFRKKKMEYFRLTIAFIFCILIQGSFQEEDEQRDGKVFSLFSIVTFPNTGCSSQSVTGNKARNGTCYTATECAEKAGTVSENVQLDLEYVAYLLLVQVVQQSLKIAHIYRILLFQVPMQLQQHLAILLLNVQQMCVHSD